MYFPSYSTSNQKYAFKKYQNFTKNRVLIIMRKLIVVKSLNKGFLAKIIGFNAEDNNIEAF